MHLSFLKIKIMKTETILQSDVLDIIFENRNKNYGAYTLRKFYNNRLYKSLGGTFAVVCLLCSFTFINSKVVKPEIIITGTTIMKDITDNKPKDKKPKEKLVEKLIAKPEVAAKQKPANSTLFTNVLVTKNPNSGPIKELTENDFIGDQDLKTPGGEKPTVGAIPSKGKDTVAIVATEKPKIDVEKPLDGADIMPAYPGGMQALTKFLQKNLTNPQEVEEGQNVAVKIKFIVGYDGKLKGFETVEDGGTAFNNEVIRVLKKMPNWIPGKMMGEAVSVYYTVPVKFVSEN